MSTFPLESVEPQPAITSLFVTTGADVEPFDRLIGWVSSWLDGAGSVTDLTIQHGTATPMAVHGGVDYLLRAEHDKALAASTVIVCSGSPAAVLDAHANGIKPIVVPRIADLDETTDDQMQLCERLSADGHVLLATTERELHRMLDQVSADEQRVRLADSDERARSTKAFAEVADDLVRTNDTPATGERVTVLYIGGVGRSGSTLMNDMLGQHESVVSVGEIVHLFERGLIENNLCGCGDKFGDCTFWAEVGDRMVGGWDSVSGEAIMAQKAEVDRNRHSLKLLMPRLFPSMRRPLGTYGEWYGRLLRTTRDVAEVPLVVDSTKQISTALMMRHLPNVDLRIVHLVRDSRGVAHSWTKKKRKVEVVGEEAMMNRYHPGLMGWRWASWNVIFASFRLLGVPVLRVHYEDLINHPTATVTRVLEFGGVAVKPKQLGFIEGDTVTLDPTHSVAGNPSRFKNGPVALSLDEAWRDKLDPRMRRLVTLLTWPLLRRYGYTGKGRP